jgi:hypothetical protein
VLDNKLLQDIVGHAKRLALGIEVFLIQVVTVVTAQVAEGTSRFDKNLKFAGSFGHCSKEEPFSPRGLCFREDYSGINLAPQGSEKGNTIIPKKLSLISSIFLKTLGPEVGVPSVVSGRLTDAGFSLRGILSQYLGSLLKTAQLLSA